MYRALAHSKFFRSLPDSCFIFDNIICDFHRPLFNIILQKNPSACIFLQCMQRDFGVCLIKLSPETSHSVLPASLFYFLSPSIAGFLFPETFEQFSAGNPLQILDDCCYGQLWWSCYKAVDMVSFTTVKRTFTIRFATCS